jgi:hypothetical protein
VPVVVDLDVHVHVDGDQVGHVDRHDCSLVCRVAGSAGTAVRPSGQWATVSPTDCWLGANCLRPGGGDGVGAPAAGGILLDDLVGVGVERQAVAADADGLAVDARGVVRGEVDDQAGDVLGSAEGQLAAGELGHRLAGRHGVDIGLEEGHSRGHRRGGDRDDGVGRDLVAGEFHGPHLGEGHDAGLGRGVVGLAEVAVLPGGRADEDESAALALLLHPHDRGTRTGEGALEVDLGDEVEVLVRHLPDDLVAQHTGVGDQDVQAAEGFDGRVDEGLGRFGRADGGGDGDGLAPGCGDLGGRGLSDSLVDVVDDDGRACAGQGLRVGEPEPPAASRDDRDLAGQVHCCSFVAWALRGGHGEPGVGAAPRGMYK